MFSNALELLSVKHLSAAAVLASCFLRLKLIGTNLNK